MKLTEEENVAGVVLLIDIGFATYSLLLCTVLSLIKLVL